MTSAPDSPTTPDLAQSISATNAATTSLQPAILANLALANEVFNANLRQQMMIAQQQALNQLMLATVGKCVSIISQAETRDLKVVHELLAVLKAMQPSVSPSAAVVAPEPAAA